jgi:hypothetical protein
MKPVILSAALLLLAAGCGSSGSNDGDIGTQPDGDAGTRPAGPSTSNMPGNEPGATSHTATEEEIIAFDAEFYAREFNVSIDEAKRRLTRQLELRVLRAEIRLAEGERVVDMRMIHEPEFGQWIYLAGDDPPTATTTEILRANQDIHIELGSE